MLSRRTLLRSSAAAGALALGAGPLTGEALGDEALADSVAVAPSRTSPVFTFVSMPDFFNGDVGDLSGLPNWDGGLNSINGSWEAAIDKCLGAVASHGPDAVFVAGDLVEGRWNIDTDDRQLFGPVSQGIDPESLSACRTAITTAGAVYYGYYSELFASRGLRVFPALGDHEILDDRYARSVNDRWRPGGYLVEGSNAGRPDNRFYLVPHCKSVWADHFTRTAAGAPRFGKRPLGTAVEHTAYAKDLGPYVTLITVDTFTRTSDGVRIGVYGPQLAWLRDCIRSAKRRGRTVIVQGHVPVMAPFRSLYSGKLRVEEGRRSGFYKALDECGADFYLAGEVHDTTVIQRGASGPVQISHGSIFRYAFNYLVGHVFADGTTQVDYYEIPVISATREKNLWSADASKRQSTAIDYGEPAHRGTLVVRNRNILKRTAKLGPYEADNDPWRYAGHLETVLY
jgi:3',5'-cyclic AMP phosphodiesterase CpdA